MKNHLKRIATPRTWLLNRKSHTFIVRPNPGAHSFTYGMPLGVLLRDHLKVARTMNEVRKLLNAHEVLVDTKRRKDHRHIVGLFDVVSIPVTKKHYRIVLDDHGRLTVIEIPAKEALVKPCRIVGKSSLKGGKLQYHLHDGRNVLTDKSANVGDTFVLSLKDGSVSEVLSLKQGSFVFLISGRHAGAAGALKEIRGTEAIFALDGQDIETATAYLFVVGNDKSQITLA